MVKQNIKRKDWCIITNLDNGDSGVIGGVFQVSEINGSYYRATSNTHIKGSCWQLSCIRLATQKEINDAGYTGISKLNNQIYELW